MTSLQVSYSKLALNSFLLYFYYSKLLLIVTIDEPGGNRNRNIKINSQQNKLNKAIVSQNVVRASVTKY